MRFIAVRDPPALDLWRGAKPAGGGSCLWRSACRYARGLSSFTCAPAGSWELATARLGLKTAPCAEMGLS